MDVTFIHVWSKNHDPKSDIVVIAHSSCKTLTNGPQQRYSPSLHKLWPKSFPQSNPLMVFPKSWQKTLIWKLHIRTMAMVSHCPWWKNSHKNTNFLLWYKSQLNMMKINQDTNAWTIVINIMLLMPKKSLLCHQLFLSFLCKLPMSLNKTSSTTNWWKTKWWSIYSQEENQKANFSV